MLCPPRLFVGTLDLFDELLHYFQFRRLCETRRFLRNVSLPLLADYRQPAYHVVPLSWFNHCSKIKAWPVLILHRTLLTNPNFRYGRNSSSTVEYSVRLSSSLWDQILRQFCSLEAFESEKTTDTRGVIMWIRLRFEEKLAFSTKYKVKQFRIICDLLDYMKRSKKNSVPIEVLLTILRQYSEKHLTHLQKFAKKKKIRVKTQPEINAFNLMLDALCKCCLVEEAEVMFKRVKSKIKPNSDTYNILFFGWCRVRNPTRGMCVLEDMIKMGHTPENFTYNTAIDTFCKAGMLTEAAELLEFMKTKGSTMSSPTAKTYAIMMVALVQNDRMDECFKILADMIDSGCLPDVSTYKELIEGMCSCGKIEAAYKFLQEMGRTGYPPDIVTYNCFLKVLCDNKDSDEALKLYKKMIDVDCMPSVQTYNILILMFFRIGDPEGAFETWNEMDRRGCPRDTDTYCVMIEGLFGCSNTRDAIYLLEQVINRGMKLPYKKFDTFLLQLSAVGDLQAIHRLSEHMRKFYNPAMARRFALNQKRKSMSLRGK
ncbi:Pentatricopeptide repeat-containing protein, mitochondrial [Sesamum angolense]|uniref:Pentatricopeptide repeat-containing protein, mitochondrial n=1 Tax=Sesamum angolense TaxID=2727404 RepID=A0AAE1W7B3_9LAMI|nr:Pentatricopeptide repeat-containing protein, mitochondrial [Sesamum angolense]